MLLSWSVPGIRSNKLFTLLARNPGFLGCVSCSVPLLLVLPVGTATVCCSLHLASAQGWVLKRKRTKKEGRVGLWGSWRLDKAGSEAPRPVRPPRPPSCPGRASSCSGCPQQHLTHAMPTECTALLPTGPSTSNIPLVLHYGLAQGPRSLHDTACGRKYPAQEHGRAPSSRSAATANNHQSMVARVWPAKHKTATIKGLN